MHIISDASMKRPGWTYQRVPGGWRGYQERFEPATINWKHINGPLMYLTNGQLHWLTRWERIQLFFGWADIHELDMKRQRRSPQEPEQ